MSLAGGRIQGMGLYATVGGVLGATTKEVPTMIKSWSQALLGVTCAALIAACALEPRTPAALEQDAATAALQSAFDGTVGTWVDLTHSFSDATTYWPTAEGFRLDTVAFGQTEGGYFYSAFNFSAAEHGGTHLDAPIHFAEGRLSAEAIPLSRLMGRAFVVDVTEHVQADGAEPQADYLATVADFVAWESANGQLPSGAIVLLRTGWGTRYGTPVAYLGTDLRGPEAISELHFPGLHPEAARWLVEERSIGAFGIDTPSIDRGQSSTFESHVVIYGANVPGFENVANLDALPATGSFVIALPMKIEGGSGAPLRIIAYLPDSGVE